MISVKNLSHQFTGTHALKDVSFTINPGSITALIGPNGSGKTTLLRLISTLQEVQEGKIYINGIDISEHPREVHRHMGYLADNFGLYEDLTVRQCLEFTAYSRLPEIQNIEALVVDCATEAGAIDFLSKKVNTLSRGMRQRVGIAQAIIHNPKIVLLDEPASGLDPEARIALSELFIRLKNRGMTLIVSSHILAELEDYSTEMLILKEGRLVEHTVLQPSAQTEEKKPVLYKVIAEYLPEGFAEKLKYSIPGIEDVAAAKNELLFNLDEQQAKPSIVLRFLLDEAVEVREFVTVKRNLQEEYLKTIKSKA
jgi:ABC-2 type transport system ATP-binding protein